MMERNINTLLTNKPASMEWGNHSNPTWMIGWPPYFNKAFVTSILTVALTCNCWGEELETPRLMEASSSSLLQLPSCAEVSEGIQNKKELTKHELAVHRHNYNYWRSCTHKQQRVLLAKYVNLIRIAFDFVWLLLRDGLRAKRKYHTCAWTRFQLNMFCFLSLSALSSTQRYYIRHSMGDERKTWTHSTCCKHGHSIFVSALPKTVRQNRFEVCTFFKSSMSAAAPVTLKALPTSLKPSLLSCKVDGHDIQTQPFPTVFYSHLLTKGHSKGTRARQKTFKVLSLIPLYQFKDY